MDPFRLHNCLALLYTPLGLFSSTSTLQIVLQPELRIGKHMLIWSFSSITHHFFNNLIPSCFLPGADVHQLYNKIFDWLDGVFLESELPCMTNVTGLKKRNSVKRCYQHLSGKKCNYFIRLLQVKMMQWAAVCCLQDLNCASVLLSLTTGKGTFSLTAQLVGPFQDEYRNCMTFVCSYPFIL